MQEGVERSNEESRKNTKVTSVLPGCISVNSSIHLATPIPRRVEIQNKHFYSYRSQRTSGVLGYIGFEFQARKDEFDRSRSLSLCAIMLPAIELTMMPQTKGPDDLIDFKDLCRSHP